MLISCSAVQVLEHFLSTPRTFFFYLLFAQISFATCRAPVLIRFKSAFEFFATFIATRHFLIRLVLRYEKKSLFSPLPCLGFDLGVYTLPPTSVVVELGARAPREVKLFLFSIRFNFQSNQFSIEYFFNN